MARKSFKIATRSSPLALWQAEWVRKQIIRVNPAIKVELLPMTTSGDRFLKDKLLQVGGKGLFVKELEEAIQDGRADLAVHSMKDVPVNLPEELCISAICKRGNPFDAFVSHQYKTLFELPHGAKVGTSSLRRQLQLMSLRPDLVVQSLRGNVQTRLKALESGSFDAVILAAAGLERLELADLIRSTFLPNEMLPACGQGAIGIEIRSCDSELAAIIDPLHDIESARCVIAERIVNAQLGGSCHTPLAVYCRPVNSVEVLLTAEVMAPVGERGCKIEKSDVTLHVSRLANDCAAALIEQGALDLINSYKLP